MSPRSSLPATWAVIAVTGALLLAGCQSSTSGTPGPTPTAVGSVSSEAPSSETADCVAPPTVCNGPLPAGDYVSDGTGAHITFGLDEHDWAGSKDEPDEGFALFLADVPEGGIYVVRFGGEVFADPCADAPGDTAPLDPNTASFVGYLAGLTGMTGNAPVELEVGGRPALQVDVAFDYQAACPGGTGPNLWLFPLPVHGDLHMADGELDRIYAVDSGSGLVTIWVSVTSADADYDHLLGHGAELLDTMAISPLD